MSREHPIKRIPVQSSNLHSVGFCPDCNSIYVAFRDKRDGVASLYKYSTGKTDTKALYDEMMSDKTESKGKFFHAKIRGLKAQKVKL